MKPANSFPGRRQHQCKPGLEINQPIFKNKIEQGCFADSLLVEAFWIFVLLGESRAGKLTFFLTDEGNEKEEEVSPPFPVCCGLTFAPTFSPPPREKGKKSGS